MQDSSVTSLYSERKAASESDSKNNRHRHDILLIQSDRDLLRRWQSELSKSASIRLSAHHSGQSALASYRRARFELIVASDQVLDVQPDVLVRMIRSGEFGYSEIPIVLVSQVQQAISELVAITENVTVLDESFLSIGECVSRVFAAQEKDSVLIVEDDPVAAESAARRLEHHFIVERAANGQAGLSAWLERRHSIVLLDLMLPGMSGPDVQQAILQTDPTQPIIVLSANDNSERKDRQIVDGATAFLGKSVGLHDLADICRSILSMTRRQRAGNVEAGVPTTRLFDSNRRLERSLSALEPGAIANDEWRRMIAKYGTRSEE